MFMILMIRPFQIRVQQYFQVKQYFVIYIMSQYPICVTSFTHIKFTSINFIALNIKPGHQIKCHNLGSQRLNTKSRIVVMTPEQGQRFQNDCEIDAMSGIREMSRISPVFPEYVKCFWNRNKFRNRLNIPEYARCFRNIHNEMFQNKRNVSGIRKIFRYMRNVFGIYTMSGRGEMFQNMRNVPEQAKCSGIVKMFPEQGQRFLEPTQ